MPQKKSAPTSGSADDEPNPNALSAALKKSHAARSEALFKNDVLSKFIKREAERGGMDPMMVLIAVIGAMAHVLNPGARRAAEAAPALMLPAVSHTRPLADLRHCSHFSRLVCARSQPRHATGSRARSCT